MTKYENPEDIKYHLSRDMRTWAPVLVVAMAFFIPETFVYIIGESKNEFCEICGIASEINKYIPKKNLLKPLCRVSKNVPFAEHLEADVIVSKKRVKEVLTNLSK